MANTNIQYNYIQGNVGFDIQLFISEVKEVLSGIRQKILSTLQDMSKDNTSTLADNLKHYLDMFEDILDKVFIYKAEAIDYFSIKNMYMHMIDYELYDSTGFLDELFEEYCTLIFSKEKVDDKGYYAKHETFKDHLIQTEEYFYLNIYKASEYFDEELYACVTNNILGD